MIKGINHQVIEVTQTDNRYYERAFLVLKPEYASAQRDLLEKEARKMLEQMDTVSCVKSKRVFKNIIAPSIISCAIGAICSALILSV